VPVVVALENFARVALDIVDEEQDVNAGAAEDRDANRNVRVERGGRVRDAEPMITGEQVHLRADGLPHPLAGLAIGAEEARAAMRRSADDIAAAAQRAGAPRPAGVTRRRGTGETPL
jgi:hypothetical protein